MALGERPLVEVRRPARGTWTAECSACGVLTDDQLMDRPFVCRAAWLHAQEFHDGDVDRSGWT